jgi:hypothetical protein
MSPSTSSRPVAARSVSQALHPYRNRLISDSVAFTRASLTLARSLDGQAPFNQASPQRSATLAALASWQGDVHGALTSVQSVDSHATGQILAVKWLKMLDAALGLARQALSLSDPHKAADAAAHAQQRIDESHRLADRLAQVLA